MAGSGFLGMFDQGSPWPGRIGLFGAGLQDAAAYLQNQPGAATHLTDFQAQRQANEARQAFTAALATGDPDKIRMAGMAFVASGGDPKGLIDMMNYGQPELKNLGENPVMWDPLKHTATPVPGGTTKAPQQRQVVRGGLIINQQWDGTKWVDQGSGPRWEGRQPSATAPVRVPHPAAGWR